MPDTKNNTGDTCLHVAARYDNKDVVKILISSRCSLSEKNQRGDTALHVAAALNHKKTVQLLLEAGIDANIRNDAFRTALDKARDNNHKELAMLLAKAPQVHRFLRGKTIKKQRGRQKTEGRSHSVTQVETQTNQVEFVEQGNSSAVEEDFPSSELLESTMAFKRHLHLHYPETLATNSSPNVRRRTKRREEQDKFCVEEKKQNVFDRKQHLFEDRDDVPVQFGKTYQLYTLYRDKDGTVRQSPAKGCHCKPLFKKLESELKATQKEMRLQILNVQERVNNRLKQIDHSNRHQIKVLDMLNQERVAAERRDMIYRIEQQATQGREEARITQQAAVKRWCLSQLKDMDRHTTPTKGHYCKLLPSPSTEHSLADTDLESLPLLSVLSGDSSSSLATYVNILPSKSPYSVGGSDQETGSQKYFEMKVDRSPDDYENTTLFPLPSTNALMSSADTPWQPTSASVQDSKQSAVVPRHGEGIGSSSSTPSISEHGPRWIPPQRRRYEHRKHSQELVRAGYSEQQNSRTLEFYIDCPAEPTFSQERNNLHAIEVTQRFFETVSTQLELWYERKLLEVEKQTELQAKKDKHDLLQRISILEEELQKMKTNDNTESTVHM